MLKQTVGSTDGFALSIWSFFPSEYPGLCESLKVYLPPLSVDAAASSLFMLGMGRLLGSSDGISLLRICPASASDC